MRHAFSDFETVYVSTFDNYSGMVEGSRFYTVRDASRFDLRPFIVIFLKALWILLRERPQVVVTTGSAPMLAFVMLGKLAGRRTLWIDSIANSQRLSSSGRIAKRLAIPVVSQWSDVAEMEGVECWGRVV